LVLPGSRYGPRLGIFYGGSKERRQLAKSVSKLNRKLDSSVTSVCEQQFCFGHIFPCGFMRNLCIFYAQSVVFFLQYSFVVDNSVRHPVCHYEVQDEP